VLDSVPWRTSDRLAGIYTFDKSKDGKTGIRSMAGLIGFAKE